MQFHISNSHQRIQALKYSDRHKCVPVCCCFVWEISANDYQANRENSSPKVVGLTKTYAFSNDVKTQCIHCSRGNVHTHLLNLTIYSHTCILHMLSRYQCSTCHQMGPACVCFHVSEHNDRVRVFFTHEYYERFASVNAVNSDDVHMCLYVYMHIMYEHDNRWWWDDHWSQYDCRPVDGWRANVHSDVKSGTYYWKG